MTKGLPRSLKAGAKAAAPIVRQVIDIDGGSLTVDGATGVGFGTLVASGLPEGNILFLGCVANLQFSGPTDANLGDTWQGDYGIGTTPASDGTITAGDVDMVDSTAIAAATAEVSPITRGQGVTQAIHDNTANTLEVNVNLLIDDADISADGIVMTVDGQIYLSYVVLGDD